MFTLCLIFPQCGYGVFHCLISDEETHAGLVQQDLWGWTGAQRALRGLDHELK